MKNLDSQGSKKNSSGTKDIPNMSEKTNTKTQTANEYSSEQVDAVKK